MFFVLYIVDNQLSNSTKKCTIFSLGYLYYIIRLRIPTRFDPQGIIIVGDISNNIA